MNTEASIFHDCIRDTALAVDTNVALSIFVVNPKNIDLLPFTILQTIGALDGLKYGEIVLPKASSVMLVEGHWDVEKLQLEVMSCDYPKDLSQIKLWSMPTYHRTILNPEVDEMVPLVDERIADKLTEWAQKEKNPMVVYHDIKSLTVGGKICKAEDFRRLHDSLKVLGASQIFFVNKPAEIEKITTRPDIVFDVSKVDDGNQTIRLSQISAIARLQDAVLPVELTLDSNADGKWCVSTSMSREDQDCAIKALAILKKTRKEIAESLGNISPSTVGRRLKAMAKNNEIIIDGHDVRLIK